jgi:hypothetical protein
MTLYRLTYQPSKDMEVEWVKTADELLVPNGGVPLIVWMYATAQERGLEIRLDEVEAPDPPVPAGVTGYTQ